MTLKNILINLARPGFAPVMAKKVLQRFFDKQGARDLPEYRAWLRRNAIDFHEFASAIDPALLAESTAFWEETKERAEKVLDSSIPESVRGGGHYPLLYFLARRLNPETVVETGVSAGFSTRAFLSAMARNGKGHLHSSDFPLFRLEQPERYIGILVEEALRPRWSLYVQGDAKNLREIATKVKTIDIFHYDSDKRYSGRAHAYRLVRGLLHPSSLLIMDDIQDNRFYPHLVEEEGFSHRIFEFEGKFVGLLSRNESR